MKSKTISVLILSITLILVSFILVSCKYDGSPTQNTSDLETLRLSKPNKPNPNKPKLNSENITFTGDLVGSQIVVGCCPNAGPYPEYTMTLSDEFPEGFPGTHTGNIFMNSFGRQLEWAYKVQFWWEEEGEGEYFIEIRGGEVHKDKRTKILIVTFTKEDTCWTWGPSGEEIINIEFTLIREPQGR